MPKSGKQIHSGYERLLLDALRRALEPLVRFLLHRGITFPVLSTLIRGLYIEQAQHEFEQDDKPLTDSRLSLLTGIARRYVKEIRQAGQDETDGGQTKVSLGGRLIAQWLTNADYLDDAGHPAPIPRVSGPDHSPSFETLVQRVNSDVWPATLLEKLVDMQLVEIDDRDHVCLLAAAYLPSNNSRESLEYFADHLHDHIAVLSHNMLGDRDPMLERSAYINNLTKPSVEQVQKLSERKASELLREVFSLAAERYHADHNEENASHRLRLGIYFYTEDMQNSTAGRTGENDKE